MRHVLLLVSVLLLGLSWAVAQNTAGQSSSPSSSPSTSAGQSSQTSAGGETTVQGCLSGSSGSYTLTDKSGTAYQLTGDTAKLSEHVGHEVKVTGTPGSSASSTASSSAAGAGTTSSSSQQSLQVSSVKHVSKTCQAGNSGMSH